LSYTLCFYLKLALEEEYAWKGNILSLIKHIEPVLANRNKPYLLYENLKAKRALQGLFSFVKSAVNRYWWEYRNNFC
jgi:hypothetical protein